MTWWCKCNQNTGVHMFWSNRSEINDMYLVFSAIPNNDEQGPVLQSDTILNLNTNSIVDLLSKCRHFRRAKAKL